MISIDQGLGSTREKVLPYYDCNTWKETEDAFKWICESEEVNKYDTVFIDDLTESAEQLLIQERPRHKNLMQAYGVLNDKFMIWIRRLRLCPKNVVLICKQDRLKDYTTGGLIYAPFFPGEAVYKQLPHLFPEVYHMESYTDTNQKPPKTYPTLRCRRDANNQFEAKTRSGLNEIELANLTTIFEKVKKHDNAT